MSERSGVEIDYCPQCRGIWLDRGELDKILERAAREMAPPPPPMHSAPMPSSERERRPRKWDSKDEYDHRGKRRKPWWAEIFD
jgi:Zn-finger nucleic acid-binding protein